MMHVLFVDILGLSALRAAMGEAVTTRAVGELGPRLLDLFRGVLAPVGGFSVMPTRPGRWCVSFVCSGPDHEETVEAVRLAAQRLTHDLVTEVFGSATGAWARVVADVLPWAADAAGLDAWLDARRGQAEGQLEKIAHLRQQLLELMESGGLRTLAQPIVDFASGRIVGYEALTRGPAGHDLEGADKLFGAAARTGLSHALECVCARQAVAWSGLLPPGLWLSVNASVPMLLDPQMRPVLARPGLVVEITEHLPIDEAPGVLPALAELRAGGARIALDDTGCGFADAAAAEILRPEIVKLCITVIRGAGRDPAILPALEKSVDDFHGLGAQVLAEGVEDHPQADALRPMGIALAQGWLFGRPVAVESVARG